MRRTVPVLPVLPALAVLSALLASGGLAGCGSPATDVRPAAAGTPTAPAGKALFASMTAAMAKADTAKVTFSSSVAQQQVNGSGAFRFAAAGSAADVTVTVPGQGRVRVLLLPDAAYLKLPASAGIPAGRPWLKIVGGNGAGAGDAAMSRTVGPLLEQLQQSFDPESNLGVLKATTRITPSGSERVGGVPTTKYTANIDLAKAAAATQGSLAQQYRTLLQNGTTSLTYSLWVDRDLLPRRFSTVVPTGHGDVTATGTYTDWGKPVRITPPPAGRVTDAADIVARRLAG